MQLALSEVSKRFGEVPALQGLSLEVEAGEFFVLLGPSAAGKTTTLRVISGLERPDSGQVLFEGRDLTHAPVQGRPMAMIFQTFALTLFGVGAALVVLGGLAFNLVPLCRPGVRAASLVKAGGIVILILLVVASIAIAAAHLYGVYLQSQ